MADEGTIKVQVYEGNTYVPINGAKVTIKQSSDNSNSEIQEQATTNSSGLTDEIGLNAPSIKYSEEPSDKTPYAFCDVIVNAPGYETLIINNCQIYPDTMAFQKCMMRKTNNMRATLDQIINIPPNTLVGNYPPKIYENPNKVLPKPTGGVVLAQPVIPEFIVVHQGVPDDDSAPNYTVRYKDYIKNVASSEIFATWPENTIRANIYCIISFTLNRIYTEWYRAKGKNFDITSSTAYDHAFTYGRNIYDNISRITDNIFSTYIKRPGSKQPLLTQYCDGVKVQCPGWFTQWGSKYLGDEGKVPYEILTNFYGNNLELKTAKRVKGIPMSYPGYVIKLGKGGEAVRTIQTYLNKISDNYPAIPKLTIDGIYGQDTQNSVIIFQGIFNLPKIGVVDYATWYRISDVYVGVTRIAELNSRGIDDDFFENKKIFTPPLIDDMINVPKTQYPY